MAPVAGSILWIRSLAIWYRNRPSNAVPAGAGTSSERRISPVAGSIALSLSSDPNQMSRPSYVTPAFYDVWACFDAKHRAFWQTVDHPVAGPHAHAGFPMRMSGTPPVAREPCA